MSTEDLVHERLVRLARLLAAEDRTTGEPLLPVHLQVLGYLARCNRYSDRPAGVAQYLGTTKGTASQTIGVLQAAGLVAKRVDAEDRRVVHLDLTAAGRRTVDGSGSRRLVRAALEGLPVEERVELGQLLERLLRSAQRANGLRSFGVCHTCRHFRREGTAAFRCGLTLEPLSRQESSLICVEHEEAHPEADQAHHR
jgi:DNA-binding MarR family transcriptional regulator